MKFTVLGSGAMGYRYGVLLQEAGNDVDFVDTWEPNVEAVKRQKGVYVSRDHENKHLTPIKMFYPEEYTGTPDVWVVFAKQMQLESLLQKTASKFDEKQYVLTCMNGMGHVEKLLKYFKPEN